ncbi:MAG: N-formylglutamate amidohydrolase, partial [bacterium]
PASLGDLGLRRDSLDLHIACDLGARQVAVHLAQQFDAPLLLANYSRLAIDLNRHLDDPTLIPATSDGIAIPGNANLSDAQRAQRIAEMFEPYHRQYARMVAHLQARFAAPLILSVHSFTPHFQGVARPWDIGLMWDEQRDLAQAVIANLRDDDDLCIGENQPYHARDPLGYAMIAHAQARAVGMALVEIRQDRIADDRGQRWAADRLHRALAPLLDDAPA